MARKLSRLMSSMVSTLAKAQRQQMRRASKALAAGTPSPGRKAPIPIPGTGSWREAVHVPVPWRPGVSPLRYVLYTPAGASTVGMPLVVMLHGCRQDAADLARGTRMNRLADRHGFLVLYPQQSPMAQATRCWRWYDPRRGAEEADAIADVIREVSVRQALDVERIFLAGLSAGAAMAAQVTLRHPDLVRSLALHSGPALADVATATQGMSLMRRGLPADSVLTVSALQRDAPLNVSVLILHGDADPPVSSRNAEQSFLQWQRLNGVAEPEAGAAIPMGEGGARPWRRQTCKARHATIRLVTMPKVGHAWSGGDARISYHGGRGPDASALIWRFFSATAG